MDKDTKLKLEEYIKRLEGNIKAESKKGEKLINTPDYMYNLFLPGICLAYERSIRQLYELFPELIPKK